jgi:hypothetical protein
MENANKNKSRTIRRRPKVAPPVEAVAPPVEAVAPPVEAVVPPVEAVVPPVEADSNIIIVSPKPIPKKRPLVAPQVFDTIPNSVKSNIIKNNCNELFDPCTREPIKDGDITILERIVRDIKNERLLNISNKSIFPDSIKTRLDLLLFILNRDEVPNDTLLQYNNNGQLYESYWDIVFTLGLIDIFPIKDNFYMYSGKIETLASIDSEGFLNNPLKYLSSRKINEGSKSGASDITFVYKENKSYLDIDLCSADPTTKVVQTCKRTSPLLTREDKKRPHFFFCSSKFFNKDSTKGVDKFDIQNIYTAAKALNQEYDRNIILLVKDKGTVEEKLRKAIRKYISEEASYVFGMEDLFASLTRLYNFIHNKHQSTTKLTKEVLTSILNLEAPPKPILQLRLHQYLATYKICDAIENFTKIGVNNKFLVGIVPRGGKTFIAGGIIDKLNPTRVVVLLGAKSETLSQFKNDLFEEFQNFEDYECVDVVNTTDMRIDPEKKYIFIMSVELYKQIDSTRPLLQELKGGVNRADLFICDEAHLKQTTSKAVKQMERGTTSIKETKEDTVVEEEDDVSEEAEESQLKELDKQIRSDTPVVYMSGTYIKPLKAFNIPDENVVIWDYQDIQQAKDLTTNEIYFKEIFGELYDRALETCMSYGQTYETIQMQYQKFPQLYLLTTQFIPEAKAAFLEQTKAGFPTISHLFEVKVEFNPETTPPERWNTGFTNPKGLMRLLNYLAPQSHQVKTINGSAIEPIPSVLNSIDSIAQRIGDRLGFFTSNFVTHSQLWFLPHMKRPHSLYKRMCALAGAVFQNSWFRKYFDIVAVSSSVKWNIPGSEQGSILIKSADDLDSCGTFSWACPRRDRSLKQCLLDHESMARNKGKGLIILAQNMLHLGISLPCVDIVVLLDVGQKVDERIQKMYRALTESTDKKGGYIVDMNYFRTVTAIMNYQIKAEEIRKGKKQIYADDIPKLFNKVLNIYYIDDDKHILRAEIEKETLPELQKLIEVGGKKSGDSILLEDAGMVLNRNIKTVVEKEYSSSYELFLGLLKEEELKQKQLRAEGENVEKASHPEETEETEESSYPDPVIFKESDTEKQKKESYIDIFKTTLKLGAFGTNSINVKSLEETLHTDEEFRQVLYDTLIKRGAIIEDQSNRDLQRNFIIDIIIRPGLNKIIAEEKNTSYYKMKESVEDEEKYPVQVEKVLSYISDHLTPKAAERHKFGEVFTPMSLVNEMLDTLPKEVWNDKSLKWLDPANGMGNFPIAVFLRLFYGFRTNDGKYIGITNEGEGDYNPGLTKVIPNEDTRRKHIVKNMLFMVELNSKNNVIAKNLFKKLAPGIEPNIIQMHRTDGFLADVEMKFPNGTIKEFDIIMGNPPFQGGAVKSVGTTATRKMRKDTGLTTDLNKNLWIPFTNKSINILKKDGYLLFIHPIGWFKPDGLKPQIELHNLMLSKQILKLRIYKNNQAGKLFGGFGTISIAYYLLQNKNVSDVTEIINILDKKEKVLLSKKSVIILAYNNILNKIINKGNILNNTDDFKQKALSQKDCNDGGKYKNIQKITEDGNIIVIKSDKKMEYLDKPKIYIDGINYPRFYYDKVGEYGIIDQNQFYIIGNNLKKQADYFKTKLSALLLKYIKYRQDFIEPRYYPDVRSLPLDKINDDTLADYFNFTKEEREQINATVYPTREYKFKEITCAQLKKIKPAEGGFYNKTRKNKI